MQHSKCKITVTAEPSVGSSKCNIPTKSHYSQVSYHLIQSSGYAVHISGGKSYALKLIPLVSWITSVSWTKVLKPSSQLR